MGGIIDQKPAAAPTDDLEDLVQLDAYYEWQKHEGVKSSRVSCFPI